MDLNLSPSEQQFRDDFRAWLGAHLPEPWTEPLRDDGAIH